MRIAGGRTDRRTDGHCFCQSWNSQIYFISNEQMAPKQRTLPTHATHTADIDGEALWLWLRHKSKVIKTGGWEGHFPWQIKISWGDDVSVCTYRRYKQLGLIKTPEHRVVFAEKWCQAILLPLKKRNCPHTATNNNSSSKDKSDLTYIIAL